MTIKELYDYCKSHGCENAEIEIDYEYGCNDSSITQELRLDDFELVKYNVSGKEFARLVLHFYR